MKHTKKIKDSILIILCFILGFSHSFAVYGESGQTSGQNPQTMQYQEYIQRLEAAETRDDIGKHGFRVVEDQIFLIRIDGVGEVSFIPAFDEQYRRLALFFADEKGQIVYRTDQLETNCQFRGQLSQPNERLAAVSFQDMDGDDRTDILLITACNNETGDYAGRSYKVGDVLFQKEGRFFRDYRLSEKINRYGMNKSIQFITAFIRDGYSTEFLYTATTEDELLAQGFQVMEEQVRSLRFEKLGSLRLVPGTYRMAEYTVFMIYLVNDRGLIVWSFQPMGDYENLYGQKGIIVQDINGDGLKDLVVLSDYSYDGMDGEMMVETDYSVYYQQTAGFLEDKGIKKTVLCRADETIAELVEELRAFWGWRAES